MRRKYRYDPESGEMVEVTSALDLKRDGTLKAEERVGNELKSGRQLLCNAETRLASLRTDGALARHQEVFAEIQAGLVNRDITVATLDHPEDHPATRHIWTSSRLPWLHLDEDLPGEPEETY